MFRRTSRSFGRTGISMWRGITTSLFAAVWIAACTSKPCPELGPGETDAQMKVAPSDAFSRLLRMDEESAAHTRVTVEIFGTGAYIEQPAETNPLALVFPHVGTGTHEHIAYVAWRPTSEETRSGVVPMEDPAGTGNWNVHRLNREEVVIGNDLSRNPLISLPVEELACASLSGRRPRHDPGCIPRVVDFLSASHPYNQPFVVRTSPSRQIAGRMEFRHGTLAGARADRCQWEVVKRGDSTPAREHFATKSVYRFVLPSNEPLVLQLRNLDSSDAPKQLVRLLPNDLGEIELRVGNAVGIFPVGETIKPGQPDPHFHVYYDFLQRVGNAPPIPVRTAACTAGPVDETTYCGQGYIAGSH